MTHHRTRALEENLQRHCAEAGQLEPICLHALTGGSRTRANLLLRASEREGNSALQAACALEMMHAATLLQDDIFDRSAQRRGRRAAYLEFGEAHAVLASDWLLLRSLELAGEVHPVFFQQLSCAARTMAATVAKELKPPALHGLSGASAYIAEICQGKTAALFAVSLHAAALLHANAGPSQAPHWAAVGNRIGCTYQLLDDCLDVYAPAGTLEKTTGVDVQQGRLTLPLLRALQALEAAGQPVSLHRFRNGVLSSEEREGVRRATADAAIRARLEDQLRNEIQVIADTACQASIPCVAVHFAVNDMEAKIALCFGEREKDAVASANGLQQADASGR